MDDTQKIPKWDSSTSNIALTKIGLTLMLCLAMRRQTYTCFATLGTVKLGSGTMAYLHDDWPVLTGNQSSSAGKKPFAIIAIAP